MAVYRLSQITHEPPTGPQPHTQTHTQHQATVAAAEEFLTNEGPELQERLKTYATDKSSYIEEFWYDSYLQYTDSVVLNLNPFFLLEDDPTPNRNDQVVRAASLVTSTLKFIHALRTKQLEPDVFRGTPLDMSQFERLFATARLPTDNGCTISTDNLSRHVVVVAHSQFYHFEVFDDDGNIALSDKEIVANLRAIRDDAAKTPITEIAKHAVGVLTTENRRVWATIRDSLNTNEINAEALGVIDKALFVVCLDHVAPTSSDDLSTNMLCGSYEIREGVQVGTCTNRWYDKLQVIVCENGSAGINFEHTGVDGHTVLRFVSDIYTDTILRFAQSISSQTRTLFHSSIAQSRRPPTLPGGRLSPATPDINPRKIEWVMTPEVRTGIRFAETRLSDLILQNDVKVLEFDKYGKSFITNMKLSPDAFVQMAFQAAYYGLYGKVECTYEPAMTKAFLHGRTEAIRSATLESTDFVKTFCSDAPPTEKLNALRKAIKKHSVLTRACSQGLGQDRHLYALECVWKRLYGADRDRRLPRIFEDKGWATLNHTIISTSNCGNPALRLFGFGPVVANGFGLGYIIKDEGIAVSVPLWILYVLFQFIPVHPSDLHNPPSLPPLPHPSFAPPLSIAKQPVFSVHSNPT
ncbi:acyltransferase ChoActase/COT/CPT [Jimgerdemannia flammicorona]|uniref:Acyltransferase ChoActase/COT/CPT n=1 Tax=Jimgerdemannia flammicorona TaxID=994334 RepID=A0A433DEC4_9FUNG|nr:acyltransferase ChoActase/COT/CPT [Jimgerdemannia flammicorona]